MPSLDDHFHALTKVRPPDSWPDVGQLVPRPVRRQPLPRWRMAVAAFALLIAGAGLVFAIRAFQRPAPATGASAPALQTPQVPPSDTAPSPKPSSSPEGGMFAAMLDAIRASSPPGSSVVLQSDRLEGDWRLDGDVDDGSGPGRLLVDVTFRPGMLVAHPCADAEFRQGGRCVERSLPGGDLLVLRDVVVDAGGMKTIDVVLVHPDRSGVGAEAGNWTIATLPKGTPISKGGLSTPRVTRSGPLYTVEQLGRLVRAVDERTRQCVREHCM